MYKSESFSEDSIFIKFGYSLSSQVLNSFLWSAVSSICFLAAVNVDSSTFIFFSISSEFSSFLVSILCNFSLNSLSKTTSSSSSAPVHAAKYTSTIRLSLREALLFSRNYQPSFAVYVSQCLYNGPLKAA